MRHAVRGRKLTRSPSHRRALRRNMVQSLFEHGQIRTTLPKAKEVRPFAEKLITLAIDGGLAARQRAIALLNDRAIIPKENQSDYDAMSDAKRAKVLRSRSGRRYRASTTRPGTAFTAESVINRLFSEIGPKMKTRNEAKGSSGGYTRIIKLAQRRLGDASPTAVLQLVDEDDKPRSKGSDKTERKRRARQKYALYAEKTKKRKGPRAKPEQTKPAAAPLNEAAETEAPAAAEPDAAAGDAAASSDDTDTSQEASNPKEA